MHLERRQIRREDMTLEEMQQKIIQCEDSVHSQIRELNRKVEAQDIELKEADKKRQEMSKKLDNLSRLAEDNYKSFTIHTEKEMEQYERIVNSIEALTKELHYVIKETKENTNYIQSIEHDAAMDKLKEKILEEERQRVAELEAPRQKFKDRVKVTLIGIIASGILGALGTILWAGFKAYLLLDLGNVQ